MNNYVKNIVEINISSNRYVSVDISRLFLDLYVHSLTHSLTYLIMYEYLSQVTHSLSQVEQF